MTSNPTIIIRSTPRYVSIVGNNPNIYLPPAAAPTAENSIGAPGELRYDTQALYVCVSNNFWKKIDLLNFSDPLDTIDGGDI
jgi:hypothetical protein